MTKTEAKALRDKWKLRVDPLACKHPILELESHEGVYLTGTYHCLYCGESIINTL